MKIVNIIGGLGNQMFQYAFAISLKIAYPDEDIMIDTHHFKKYELHNGYEIDKIFSQNISIPIASKKDLLRLTYYVPNYKLSRLIRKVFPKLKTEYIEPINYLYHPEVYKFTHEDIYYEGFWQSYKYYQPIADELRKVFVFKDINSANNLFAKQIISCESVGLHIRRGDYLNHKDYQGICDIDYYKRAIEHINPKDKSFYVFSNDLEWCKENITPLLKGASCCFVDLNKGSNSYYDIYLMSKCRYLIIANSSFSWWGAFLNTEVKEVVAPKKWINRSHDFDIYLPEWIKF